MEGSITSRGRSASFLSKPTIRLVLERDVIFVNPQADDLPAHDSLLFGTVIVDVKRKMKIKAIKVELQGLCDAFAGGMYPYQSSVTLNKQLELNLRGETFDVGEHSFAFSLIIPSNTPVSLRTEYGRIRHLLKASATFTSNLLTSISTPTVPVLIKASPVPIEDLPPAPLYFAIEHISEDLGPMLAYITCPHLTIASLFYVRLHFLAPPSVAINSVTGFVRQEFEIHYTKTRQCVVNLPPKRWPCLKVDPALHLTIPSTNSLPLTPLSANAPPPEFPGRRPNPKNADKDVTLVETMPIQRLSQGQDWCYTCVMRISEDEIKPTTLPDTHSPIRIKHGLVLEISYEINGERKKFSIGTPAVIGSCCCLVGTPTLPAYAKEATIVIDAVENPCLCNTSAQEILEREESRVDRPVSSSEFSEPTTLQTGKSAVDWIMLAGE